MIGTKKFTLYPVGDKAEVNRVYDYIRKGQKVFSQMLNICISVLYTSMLNGDDKEKHIVYNEDGTPKNNPKTNKPTERSNYDELQTLGSRTPDSKLGSLYAGKIDINDYPTGLPLAGTAGRKADMKLKDSRKKGLFEGKVSLPTFKKDIPLDFPKMYVTPMSANKKPVGIYYDTEKYPTPMDFYDALMNDRNVELYLKFCNDITFKFCLGNLKDSLYLRKTLVDIFNGVVEPCDSSICVDGKRIILNMSMDFPTVEHTLDKTKVMGIDVGFVVPLMCAFNDDDYLRLAIGDGKFIRHHRIMFQEERRALAKALRMSATNGKGRTKKLKPLDELKSKEKNFVKTQNQIMAKRAVNFALKHNAGVIQMENLKHIARKERDKFLLRNWGYFELQQAIEFKAQQYGIEVRYVEPAYTSQVCSICGHRGIRNEQSKFICTNPECKIHGKYQEAKNKAFDVNADFNGARNIALSDHFITDGTKSVELVFNSEFNENTKAILNTFITEGQTYTHCYVAGNTVSIMSDDGYWHDFDLSIIQNVVDAKSVDRLTKTKKTKKKSDDTNNTINKKLVA